MDGSTVDSKTILRAFGEPAPRLVLFEVGFGLGAGKKILFIRVRRR